MAEKPLYKVQNSEMDGNKHIFHISLNPNHSIFKGHFPEQPVVPGVCTLQIIRECVGKIVKKEIRYSTISSCKFSAMIIPSENIVDVSIDLKDDCTIQALVAQNGDAMLRLKANYVEV